MKKEEKINMCQAMEEWYADAVKEGVQVAVTFQQKGPQRWRVSMRSDERVNSSVVCKRLGGGGHQTMAGAQFQDADVGEVAARLRAAIEEYLAGDQEDGENSSNAPSA